MDAPWVPPYFGSWDHLVQELLGNPFLGSGGGPRHLPRVEALTTGPGGADGEAANPQPQPWRAGAAGYLVSVLGLREAAAIAGERGAEVVRSADRAIDQFIDDYCGTPWHVPWPVPGPGPWVYGLATQLSLIANTLQQGELRAAILQLAGRVISKGVA
jgi:hypothetical protein